MRKSFRKGNAYMFGHQKYLYNIVVNDKSIIDTVSKIVFKYGEIL